MTKSPSGSASKSRDRLLSVLLNPSRSASSALSRSESTMAGSRTCRAADR